MLAYRTFTLLSVDSGSSSLANLTFQKHLLYAVLWVEGYQKDKVSQLQRD
jgi:hypothetical protein